MGEGEGDLLALGCLGRERRRERDRRREDRSFREAIVWASQKVSIRERGGDQMVVKKQISIFIMFMFMFELVEGFELLVVEVG